MDKAEAAAYVGAMVACALIEAKGMEAENQIRVSCGGSPIFGKVAFDELIERYGIHHNAVLLLIRNCS